MIITMFAYQYECQWAVFSEEYSFEFVRPYQDKQTKIVV